MGVKGSWRRPKRITDDEWDSNYALAFRKDPDSGVGIPGTAEQDDQYGRAGDGNIVAGGLADGAGIEKEVEGD